MFTIDGSGFGEDAAAVSVTVGGSSAPVNSVSSSAIETEVPSGLETGPAAVEVSVGDRTATGPDFTVERAAPGISSVDPDSGTVGTAVTITGMNFSPTASENTITFGGTMAPVINATNDQLQTEVPEGAPDGPIEVTVGQKTATGPDFDVIRARNQIVFDSDRDSDGERNFDIYIMNPDGSDVTRLTTSAEFEFGPEISPDGNKIAFASERDGNREVYTMDPDGSNLTRITTNSAQDGQPTWSPDGSKIAFISRRDGRKELFTINADGSGAVQQLTDNGTFTNDPDWSPDGSKIAYHSRDDGDDEIYTVNPDGTGKTQVTVSSTFNREPSWSPDGSKIAFRSQVDGDYDIYTINPDGTGSTEVLDTDVRDASPTWSPDGETIVFQSERPGNRDLYRMTNVGSNLTNITNDPNLDGRPDWGPSE